MTLALSRRVFLASSASLAGGLLVAAYPGGKPRTAAAQELGYYVRIEPDGRIVIGAPSTEMGQGINTSMPMLVAEELDADWSRVTIEQLPLMIKRRADGKSFDWVSFPQGAGGSTSTIDAWPILREAGGRARRLLRMAAASRWNVPVESCATEPGFVVHSATARKLAYGELAATAGKLTDPTEAPPLKTRGEYRLLGTKVRNAQAEAIATGRAEFGIDAEIPGMLYAVVARAPKFDSRIESIDDAAARAVSGVQHIVRLDGPQKDAPWYPIIASGVAVTATSLWSAMKGRDALKIAWSASPAPAESTESMRAQMADLLTGKGHYVNDAGDVDAALKSAAKVIERIYDEPFVAHATMEPQNCVAYVRSDGVDIVAPTQSPGSASRLANEITGIDRSKINVRMTRLGGGFGRRLEIDFIGEAILISKAAGKPIKLVWTREDDLKHDFYRPACRQQIVMGVDADRRIIAWDQRVASTPKNHRRHGVDEATPWGADLYKIDFPATLVPNYRREYFAVQSAAPRRSWRAPGHTANAFAIHSFLDEAAHELGIDPLQFLLGIVGDGAEIKWDDDGTMFSPKRHAGVLTLAAENAGWGAPLPPGHGRGIAAHFTFTSYCAHVVEVHMEAGRLVVDKVTSAIDCGFAVNPLGVRAQVEGGINDALSTALGQAITIRDGAVVESNFDTYRMMRIDQSPRLIDVHIMDSPHDPTGVGEPPVPPLAPALCNAIFAATGKRIRRLPIADQLST